MARGVFTSVITHDNLSVITTALVISGLPTDRFIYLGFLPRKSNTRRRFLESITKEEATILALESPHRLLATLNDILLVLGDRRVAICRELTKIHEEVFRGKISQAIEHFTQPRGEFTLVIEGKREENKPQLTPDIEQQLRHMRQSGLTAKEATTKVASQTGLSKRELYQTWLRLL